MRQQLLPALRAIIFLTLITGLAYPALVTGLCQVLFPHQANGSLLPRNGQVIGSALLGQSFTQAKYFHTRPSAAGANGYDASASSGSNLGPTSQKLIDRVKASALQFRIENPSFSGPIPADALTASASGLDPDISVANAEAQITRVAAARHADPEAVSVIIRFHSQGRDLGFLGESRVNVLAVNLELDREFKAQK
jgi:K+-transporting ATPase ATPase C chain